MATSKGTGGIGEDGLYNFTWDAMAASADVGVPITIPAHVRDLVIQAGGTFGGSLAIQLQGSNNGTDYYQLKDTGGTVISLSTTTGVAFANPPKFIKPVATAGSGGGAGVVSIHGSVLD